MRKTIAILLVLSLFIGLSACGQAKTPAGNKQTAEPSVESTEVQIDDYQKLYDYVVRTGKSEGSASYIYQMGDAANVDLMLIAENNTLRYWCFASYKNSNRSFMISYQYTLPKDGTITFDFDYSLIDEYYNGVAIGGETAKARGTIDVRGQNVKFSSEKYAGCDQKTVLKEIKHCHNLGTEFINDVMKDASIGCTFEQLIS